MYVCSFCTGFSKLKSYIYRELGEVLLVARVLVVHERNHKAYGLSTGDNDHVFDNVVPSWVFDNVSQKRKKET